MKTYDYIFGGYGDLYWPAIVAGLAMALLAGALSVFVVTRRLAFVGQGVSHTAFGGVGVAAVLGLSDAGQLTPGGYGVVALFCIGSALLIGMASGREGHREDTLIGVVLVASMAMGMLLLNWQRTRAPGARVPSFESVLFGSFLGIGKQEAIWSWVIAAVVLAVVWWKRRALVFVVFDELAAESSGVSTRAMRAMLFVSLAVTIAMVMKLSGVVLASAMLVLPGATALGVTDSLRKSVAFSLVAAVAGVLGGVVLSFESNWPTGPSIVTVMVGIYLGSFVVGAIRSLMLRRSTV